ncbi:hypothetical protein [Altererythrobacter sp. MF3-039]|uniref:hypothetical protein n=1 Tax=Altererythrobacter sp. MF3-039 TaxID=3252901 RepID=UPI00390C83DF
MTYVPSKTGSTELFGALERELRDRERILWQGEQIARIAIKGFALYFFAIPWTAFAVFWTAMASLGAREMQDEASWLAWAFPAFGIPFILVGIGMLGAPFLPALQKGKVLYAVTNQRVLRIKAGRSFSVKSVPARRIGMVERSEKADGSGSLKIAIGIGTDSDGDRTTEYFELGEVENVRSAHDQIATMSRAAS